MRLIAKVGMNIGEKRFEEEERITGVTLSAKQLKYLLDEGYAVDKDKEPKTAPKAKEGLANA